ncbi:hypothetical protein FXF46_14965 [Gluconobacter thailandicus]|uniref:Uncharacterized protein n=1 Tax=Gluconobacter thailandicus TaxID=257438 RepID=A0AAP9JJ16_GLUTH|nr:hypothetical protein FXF46_14965 [Gluconobacter thailandicus]
MNLKNFSHYKRFSKTVVLPILLLALYLVLAIHVSSLWPKTSDQASYFLAGLDVLHGNWRLKGWVLTPPDFWTSDIALSAALAGLWRLLGHPAGNPFLLIMQPAILWTGVVASAFAVVFLRLPDPKARLGAAALLLPVLAFPLMRSPIAYFITLSAIHMGVLIYGIWAFHWADRFLSSGSYRSLAIMALLLCLGVIGDPLLAITGAGSLLLYAFLAKELSNGRRALLVGGTLFAVTLAKITLHLNVITGGFETEGLETRFATWEQLSSNLLTTFRSILLVYGAEPSGQIVGAVIPECLRLALVVLALAAAYRVARTAWASGGQDNPFCSLLIVSALLDFTALAISNRIALDGSPLAVGRYLFPLWLDLACIAALVWPKSRMAVGISAAVLAVTLITDYRDIPPYSTGILSSEDNQLLSRLEKDFPPDGIGSWWSSGNLEVASLGKIHVYPAMIQGNGTIAPFVHIRKRLNWHSFDGKAFFVVIPHPDETFNEGGVIRTFGIPAARMTEGRYTILLYNADHLPARAS